MFVTARLTNFAIAQLPHTLGQVTESPPDPASLPRSADVPTLVRPASSVEEMLYHALYSPHAFGNDTGCLPARRRGGSPKMDQAVETVTVTLAEFRPISSLRRVTILRRIASSPGAVSSSLAVAIACRSRHG